MNAEDVAASNRGWNRASIVFWSRKPYRPAVTREDFHLPRGVGNVRMLAMCALMATCLTVLYLWFPLFVAGLFVPLGGALYGGILGGTALALTALMYVRGVRD
jgi:hypothetical protein